MAGVYVVCVVLPLSHFQELAGKDWDTGLLLGILKAERRGK